MAFGGFNNEGASQPMAEINMIPLIDVMLVLLVIFMVTAPLLTHAIKINLPNASTEVNQEKPQTVTLSIDAAGQVYWNDAAVGKEELDAHLTAAAHQEPQPEVHLRADQSTQYQKLAEVLAAARNARIARIGFITEPNRK
jgi:biopolymer transport protein ExbD